MLSKEKGAKNCSKRFHKWFLLQFHFCGGKKVRKKKTLIKNFTLQVKEGKRDIFVKEQKGSYIRERELEASYSFEQGMSKNFSSRIIKLFPVLPIIPGIMFFIFLDILSGLHFSILRKKVYLYRVWYLKQRPPALQETRILFCTLVSLVRVGPSCTVLVPALLMI